ncbi:hypothetical protein ESOMN_v1c04770 [Williamsoniiplasma somnilux]|uniref:Uncharacterized protein n=1 Tax=Williamsoniiplasma somnilux TaxID=215578 RepID=A0A2K8NYG7_9MOLU|nr:hypothetical protein [Williamsoniiplasma somnilux]ATZ18859.1 hypothetical protein ESOMN_v1c04770 [Williamsoniiplasma somnilux]
MKKNTNIAVPKNVLQTANKINKTKRIKQNNELRAYPYRVNLLEEPLHMVAKGEKKVMNKKVVAKSSKNTISSKPVTKKTAVKKTAINNKTSNKPKEIKSTAAKKVQSKVIVQPILIKEVKPKQPKSNGSLIKKITSFVNENYETKPVVEEIVYDQSNKQKTNKIVKKIYLNNNEENVEVLTASNSKLIFANDNVEIDKKTINKIHLNKNSAFVKKKKKLNFFLYLFTIMLINLVLIAFVMKLANAQFNGDGITLDFIHFQNRPVLIDISVWTTNLIGLKVDFVANVIFIIGIPVFGLIFLIYLIIYLIEMHDLILKQIEFNNNNTQNIINSMQVETTSVSTLN